MGISNLTPRSGVGILAGLLVFTLLLSLASLNGRAPFKDGAEYVRMAHFLAVDGLVSTGEFDASGAPLPTMVREPALPFVYAFAMYVSGVDVPPLECIVLLPSGNADPRIWGDGRPACDYALSVTRIMNVLLLLGLVSLAYFGTSLVVSHPAPRLLFAATIALTTLFPGKINESYTELLAALVLLAASLSLHAAFFDPRRFYLWCVVAGVLLGGLILTRAVFFYIGPVLVAGAVVLALRDRSFRPIITSLAVIALGYSLASVWMLRNLDNFGVFKVAEDRAVIGTRVEYNGMTSEEYLRAWLRYSPFYRDHELGGLWPDDVTDPLSRRNPNGYYRRGVFNKGRAAAATGVPDPTSDEIQSAALRLIIEEPMAHLTTTPLFMYRGMFPNPGVGHHFVQSISWRLMKTHAAVSVVIVWTVIPIGLLLFLRALLLGRMQVAVLGVLPMFSFFLYGLMTHNIPRYSEPLIPILTFIVILEVWRWWVTRRTSAAVTSGQAR